MSNNSKGQLWSAVIGGVFFTIPYAFLNIPLLASLGVAAVAYGAGNLIFSNTNGGIKGNSQEMNLYDILQQAKQQNSQIYAMMGKVEDRQLVSNIKEVHLTVCKIIDTISKNPDKLDKARTFFDYYLPVTLKILKKYDMIENQRLVSSDSKEIMENTRKMIEKINQSFKIQLSNLYEADIIDTDAELKVFDQMLKSDGFNPDQDFKL